MERLNLVGEEEGSAISWDKLYGIIDVTVWTKKKKEEEIYFVLPVE